MDQAQQHNWAAAWRTWGAAIGKIGRLWRHGAAAAWGAALCVALAACGGGGGGSGGAAEPAPTQIGAQPVSASATSGSAVTWSVAATGETVSYQWQRSTDAGANWATLAGATGASYTIAVVDASMNGQQFRVLVSGLAGIVTSSAVTLTVTPAPVAVSITVQPAEQALVAGATASFSVTASGTAPSYQWQSRPDSASAWADISGAVSSTLTITAVSVANNGTFYRAVVSNSVNSAPSNAALLSVSQAPALPTITTQPASASVTAPSTATFVVVAAGAPTPACQWQQSLNNGTAWATLTGATACSYTTPATSTADSAKQYRALVSNSVGSVTSAAATLTVSAAAVAPAITTQPQSQTVTVPATATFAVVATGTPTPALQWQLSTDAGATFANITGATASTYTTAATAVADTGKRLRAVASNIAGTQTSSVAVLTVNASAGSPLSGRTWRTGQKLVAGDVAAAFLQASVIDDVGSVTLFYGQSDGTRSLLKAMKGVPNASNTAPSWSSAVTLGPVGSGQQVGNAVAVAAPGGDVGVLWAETKTCDATDPPGATSCYAGYVGRYRAATSAWEAPTRVNGLEPYLTQTLGAGVLSIDDQGDVVVAGPGWVASGSNSYTAKSALFLRTANASTFRTQLIDDPKLNGWALRLDNQGQLLVGANYVQNGTTDIVAFRGTVAAGLTMTPTVLDTRASAAQLQAVAVGLNGQQAILWSQNNGVRDTWYSAIANAPGTAFTVADMGVSLPTTDGYLVDTRRTFITDAGDVLVYELGTPQRVQWTAAAGWGAAQSIPELGIYSRRVGFNRRGDYLRVDTADVGASKAYDGARNLMLPAPGYVLGTATQANNAIPYFYIYNTAYADPLLSVNGVGFNSIRWYFDVLPTPALPAGDGRLSVTNLWGVYLK